MKKIIFVLMLALASVSVKSQVWYSSTAYQASQVIKAAPGQLYGLTGFNSSASAVWIQIFNSATLPADGVAPVITIYVPATTNFSWSSASISQYQSNGITINGVSAMWFSSGITIVSSSTGPTKTIISATAWWNVLYQ